MLTKEKIRKMCSNDAVFYRGMTIYQSGMIDEIELEEGLQPDTFDIEGLVDGSYGNQYDVFLTLDPAMEEITDYGCDCLAFSSYPGMCKHCAALALEYLERESSGLYLGRRLLRKMRTDAQILDLIRECTAQRNRSMQTASGEIELEAELMDNGMRYNGTRQWYLTFKVGNTRKYVIKNLTDFIDAVEDESTVAYGKQLSFMHSKNMFTEKAWQYIELIAQAVAIVRERYGEVKKEMWLQDETIEKFLMINLEQSVTYRKYGCKDSVLHIIDENPKIRLKISEDDRGGYLLKIPALDFIEGEKERFVKIGNKVYHCTPDYAAEMGKILLLADNEREKSFEIAKEDMAAFYGAVGSALEEKKRLDKGKLSFEEYRPKPVEISYYLDEENGRVLAKVMGKYGDEEYNLLKSGGEQKVYHDILSERQALEAAKAYFPEESISDPSLYFPADSDDRMYQLLSTGINQLEAIGKVYATERIKGRRIVRAPKSRIGVTLKSGLLELSLDNDEFSRQELAEILESYRKKKKYFRMRNGDFLKLEEGTLSTIAELLDGLMLKKKDLEQDVIGLPKYRACYIDQILQKNDSQIDVRRDTNYKAVIRSMKNVEDSDYLIPDGMEDVLRGYQKNGYRWMRTLAGLGFGGILADDMGLGKTIQAITYLLARKQEGVSENPSLIICPASLIYNWQNEILKFAPKLTIRMITGSAEKRAELIGSEEKTDVWITSYDMAKRDVSLYGGIVFDTEIIDEAQNIKNQGTQAAKAVKKIQAQVRFALTGTPIENRLSELWSIFDYLMPGILGTHEKFKKEYETPIMQEEDKTVSERLRKMVSPFILRRMKQDVLTELPDKVEQNIYVQMEEDQRKLYAAHVERMLEKLRGQSDEEVHSGKLQILAELTRLRQICCDPELVYENYNKLACKIEICEELVNEAVTGGHKVLIFSQFTSLFPILESRLKADGITCYTLTGETPKERRIEMAESFNQDDVPVFLISLKAGGTGLNLTGANIVIHFDPWWNLAAQNQATDRVHRIGQTNQVMVYKLIARDTIEEKIIALQERKQELAGEILSGEGMAVSKLTKEDFMEILNP